MLVELVATVCAGLFSGAAELAVAALPLGAVQSVLGAAAFALFLA